MTKTKLIVVAGPTASGKTRLGIEIAKAVGGEIISADSMQVYKGMGIATAAPTESERAEVPHHLVEFLDRSESYSVSDFCSYAEKAVGDITGRHKVPVLVGGTGLFIDSFVDHIKFTQAETDFKLRERLMAKSADVLYDELLRIDPQAAENIHKNNKSRVARAVEIYYTSGKTKSMQNEHSRLEEAPMMFCILCFAIKTGNCFTTELTAVLISWRKTDLPMKRHIAFRKAEKPRHRQSAIKSLPLILKEK